MAPESSFRADLGLDAVPDVFAFKVPPVKDQQIFSLRQLRQGLGQSDDFSTAVTLNQATTAVLKGSMYGKFSGAVRNEVDVGIVANFRSR